jgi:hemerythrin-like metal-binding protein
MSRMPWLNSMNIGNDHLDGEHRRMFDLMGDLAAALQRGAFQAAHDLAVTFLAQIDQHFRFEDELMRRSGYPGVVSHTAKHAQARAQVVALGAALTPPRDIGRADRILDSLEGGYFRALLIEDMLLARFVEGQSIPQE